MSDARRTYTAGRAAKLGRACRRLDIAEQTWRLKTPLRIAGHTFAAVDVVVVTLEQEGLTGRGEAAGVYYLGDDPRRMVEQINTVRPRIEKGADREELRSLLPCGGARNAVDCALWDLDAACSGRPVWDLAGQATPVPVLTTFTIGAVSSEETALIAQSYENAKALKLKLTGDNSADAGRVRAARWARPDVRLAVDANQGYDRKSLEAMLPIFADAGVSLIEQPLAVGREIDLEGLDSPIPLAADESVQGIHDIAPLAGLVDVINIKLDKCGGLTEGLEMVHETRRHGLKVMVGNMVGTSLSTAPAYILGQLCDVVDLDGPFLLARDREPPVEYENGMVFCPSKVWGNAGSAGIEE